VGWAALETAIDRFDVIIDVLNACMKRAWIPMVPASRMHL
jgi:hypothetical protein